MMQHMETWCDRDEHRLFEHFIDFNEWLDSGEEEYAQSLLAQNNIENFAQPSKAFYAGDKEGYEQAFKAYRLQRRHEVLSKEYLTDAFNDDHWYDRNEERFNQLINRLIERAVVPFVGAGISVAGGFPTWKAHLRQQGRTAGICPNAIEAHLEAGEYEAVIESIEAKLGRDVFAQEIRDVFSKTGSITDVTLRLSELFADTVITTNYDRLLEQVFDTGADSEAQVINGLDAMETPDPLKTTIIKLHGDIKSPQRCILGKKQYDAAYGIGEMDINLPIPKLLKYYFLNSSLLFVGCSLHNDRTIQVFKTIKEGLGDRDLPQHFSIEQAPETEGELITRNGELLRLGITAIWYEAGQYDRVESILRHARNEVMYQQGASVHVPTVCHTHSQRENGGSRVINSFKSVFRGAISVFMPAK